jgi:hypothetical protein
VECSKRYGSGFSIFEKSSPSLLENYSRIEYNNISYITITN